MTEPGIDGRSRHGPRSLRRLLGESGAVHIPSQRHDSPIAPAEGATGASVPTRRLCSLVHVEEELRAEVNEHFPVRGHRAWAPCYAVDLVALLWHTRRADRLAALRDLLLSLDLLAVAGVSCHALFGLSPPGMAAVVGVAVSIGIARWVFVRREMTVRSIVQGLWRYSKKQRKRFARRSAVAAGATALAVSLLVNHPGARLTVLAVAGGLALAWVIVATVSAVAHVRASRVLTTHRLADITKTLPAQVEERARRVSAGNVLFYARERARGPLGPFIGAGHRLSSWNTPPVDVTKPLRDLKENGRKPQEVDVAELHHRLAAAAMRPQIEHMRCEQRLYVDGRALARMPHLRTDPKGPPSAHVPETEVLQRVREPDKFQRGYLCLSVTAADGDIVVTMFVRAILQKDLLVLEISVHGLPEVTWPRQPEAQRVYMRPGMPVVVEQQETRRSVFIPRSKPVAVWHGVRGATRSYWPLVLGCLRRTAGTLARPGLERIGALRERRAITDRRFDFGAKTSLREHLALRQEMHHNAFVDMTVEAARLQHRLVGAVAEYLRSLGIDPGDFTQQSATIINHIQQNVISSLNAGAVTFGAHSPVNGQPPPVPPYQPTQPANQGTP